MERPLQLLVCDQPLEIASPSEPALFKILLKRAPAFVRLHFLQAT